MGTLGASDERHLHLGSKSGVMVAGAVLLGLYAAYVAGYFVRTFSWWVTRPTRWLRKEELRPEELKKAIGDAYGPRSLERILDRHPSATLGVLGVILFVVWKSVQLARDEVSDSLRNLCLSIWFDDAA